MKMLPGVFHSHSIDETQGHARKVAEKLKEKTKKRVAALILLNGSLGAGKTKWARSFINAYLGKDEVVTSPTYSLVNGYRNKSIQVFHVDLYRLEGVDDLESIGFWDLLADRNVVVVEWGKRLPFHWPSEIEVWEVDFEIINDSQRKIAVNLLVSQAP